jgi:hypothetical protein
VLDPDRNPRMSVNDCWIFPFCWYTDPFFAVYRGVPLDFLSHYGMFYYTRRPEKGMSDEMCVCLCVFVSVFVYGGEVHLVSKCSLESPSEEEQLPVVFRTNFPISKHVKSWREKYGQEPWRDSKPRIIVLAKISSNLTGWPISLCKYCELHSENFNPKALYDFVQLPYKFEFTFQLTIFIIPVVRNVGKEGQITHQTYTFKITNRFSTNKTLSASIGDK